MLAMSLRGALSSRQGRATLLAAVGVAWAAAACQEDEARPPLVPDCNDPACIEARGSSRPTGVSSGSAAGAGGGGGAAGGGGMPEPSAAALTGSVLQIGSQDLLTRQSLQQGVQVRAPGARAADGDVTEPAEPDGSYALEDIRWSTELWVSVGHFADPPVEPFIDTLQVVDSTRTGGTDLFVMPRELLREIASAAFLMNPSELDPAGAHLLIRFVDGGGDPVEGVSITSPSPGEVLTAYDAGSIYSEALTATSERGAAVLINYSAPPYPGTPLTLRAEIGGEAFTASLRVAAGAVTLVDAVVPDP